MSNTNCLGSVLNRNRSGSATLVHLGACVPEIELLGLLGPLGVWTRSNSASRRELRRLSPVRSTRKPVSS